MDHGPCHWQFPAFGPEEIFPSRANARDTANPHISEMSYRQSNPPPCTPIYFSLKPRDMLCSLLDNSNSTSTLNSQSSNQAISVGLHKHQGHPPSSMNVGPAFPEQSAGPCTAHIPNLACHSASPGLPWYDVASPSHSQPTHNLTSPRQGTRT